MVVAGGYLMPRPVLVFNSGVGCLLDERTTSCALSSSKMSGLLGEVCVWLGILVIISCAIGVICLRFIDCAGNVELFWSP